ncbi:MAG: glycosyltransferase family 4 protein [Pseudomonadota bacterium]
MRPLHLVVPGSLDQRTGGYLYDKRIVEGLRAQGREVVVHELAGDFPLVDTVAREAARAAADRFAGGVAVIDGLALPALHDRIDQVPAPWVALVHHPLAMETGLAPDEVEALAAIERHVLRYPARVIVTSRQTVEDLAAFDVAQERIGVVLPGTDPAPLASGSEGPGVALLCVASLTPRKGHLVLLQALAELVDLDWHLNCVGSADRDPDTAAQIRNAIEDLGLRERVTLAGEQDEAGLVPYYDGADVFVLASYHEGYGMALAEALARGLPIISTNAGAIPGTVPSDAGILVDPGDKAVLTEALGRIITERPLRNRLAAGARTERDRLPSWDDASRQFAEQLDQVVG